MNGTPDQSRRQPAAANSHPKELDGARLLYFAEITEAVCHTGRTIHRVNGQVLGPAGGLAICQYADSTQFYLFYCSADWAVLTDTCHESLDEARHQAEWEYEGISKYWTPAARD